MKKEDALKIPELQIFPDDLIEDCFFYLLAEKGKLSEEQRRKAIDRLHGRMDEDTLRGSMIVARMMCDNLEKYGVACAGWAEE
jgi:hypothetical protein